MIFIHAMALHNRNKCKHRKYVENIDGAKSTFWRIGYATKYLKQRLKYSSSHPGSFKPAVITNKEVHMVFGNMENTKNNSKNNLKRKIPAKVSDYFVKSDKQLTCVTSEFKIFPKFINKSIILLQIISRMLLITESITTASQPE